MTLSELKKYRLGAPYLIASVGLIPCFSLSTFASNNGTLGTAVILTGASVLAAFLYTAFGLGKAAWVDEIDREIGPQIRRRLLALIPRDLNVTDDERLALSRRDVFKKLTGVFWEAVDADPQLTKHKEHFYANGLQYSTAIDGAYLLTFLAGGYLVAFILSGRVAWAVVAGACIIMAAVCQWIALPRYRQLHKELSREQLDLLERNQLAFVQERFRAIVTQRRNAQPLP
jgi:hypothetical protein